MVAYASGNDVRGFSVANGSSVISEGTFRLCRALEKPQMEILGSQSARLIPQKRKRPQLHPSMWDDLSNMRETFLEHARASATNCSYNSIFTEYIKF